MTGKKRAAKGLGFTGIVRATKGLAAGKIVVLSINIQVTLTTTDYSVQLSIY